VSNAGGRLLGSVLVLGDAAYAPNHGVSFSGSGSGSGDEEGRYAKRSPGALAFAGRGVAG
jgi:hypothetical protein